MLRKKSKIKQKIVNNENVKQLKQNPFRDALITVFGEDEVERLEKEIGKGPKKYRIKFTFKPLKEFLEANPHFFDCSPEQKEERIMNYPFIDVIEDAQRETFKYNIVSIKQDNEEWVVEYFDYEMNYQTFNGTKEQIVKFFDMDYADLYYIAKVVIPKNNRIDSPLYKLIKKHKKK